MKSVTLFRCALVSALIGLAGCTTRSISDSGYRSGGYNQVTKVVSWIPIAGYIVPDQEQQMRIRVKAVIVDVATGQWSFVSPPPASSSDFASRMTRAETDQALVAKLKETCYRSLVQTLVAGET